MGLKQTARNFGKVALCYLAPKTAVWYMIRTHTPYEPEVDLLPELVDPAREAIDVGANLGIYTNSLTRLATHVLAFEAHPRLARVLRRTFNANASVYHAAVSDQPGNVVLKVPVMGGNNAEGLGSLEASAVDSVFHSITVPAMVLDDFAERDIGFVKIDVEGHELKVLDGAQKLIERQRPVFLVEAEDRHKAGAVSTVMKFFADRNYEGVFVRGRDILSVRDFRPEMQDAARTPGDAFIHSDSYTNNFIFIPSEAWSEARRGRLARLRASALGRISGAVPESSAA